MSNRGIGGSSGGTGQGGRGGEDEEEPEQQQHQRQRREEGRAGGGEAAVGGDSSLSSGGVGGGSTRGGGRLFGRPSPLLKPRRPFRHPSAAAGGAEAAPNGGGGSTRGGGGSEGERHVERRQQQQQHQPTVQREYTLPDRTGINEDSGGDTREKDTQGEGCTSGSMNDIESSSDESSSDGDSAESVSSVFVLPGEYYSDADSPNRSPTRRSPTTIRSFSSPGRGSGLLPSSAGPSSPNSGRGVGNPGGSPDRRSHRTSGGGIGIIGGSPGSPTSDHHRPFPRPPPLAEDDDGGIDCAVGFTWVVDELDAAGAVGVDGVENYDDGGMDCAVGFTWVVDELDAAGTVGDDGVDGVEDCDVEKFLKGFGGNNGGGPAGWKPAGESGRDGKILDYVVEKPQVSLSHGGKQQAVTAAPKGRSKRHQSGVGEGSDGNDNVLDIIMAKRQVSLASAFLEGVGSRSPPVHKTSGRKVTETRCDSSGDSIKGNAKKAAAAEKGSSKELKSADSKEGELTETDTTLEDFSEVAGVPVGAYYINNPRSGWRRRMPGMGRGEDFSDNNNDNEEMYEAVTGLPIAMTVEWDDVPITTGIASGPASKPGIGAEERLRALRLRLYIIVGTLTTVVVAVGVAFIVLLASRGGKGEEMAVTMAPTAYRETLGIQEQIERAVGSVHELLNSDGDSHSNPYMKALDWIINVDPMQLMSESPNLIQRYTAAYLYYATTVNGPWKSCNPNLTDSSLTICDFSHSPTLDLIQMQFLDHPNYKRPGNRWLSNTMECKWAGVVCDKYNQIIYLDLGDAGLSAGSFPEGIYNLPFLEHVTLSNAKLRGPLPADLFERLLHMSSIILSCNFFTGSIPHSWWQSNKLKALILLDNRLTGSIPTEVGNLRHTLKILDLMKNKLTGSLPTELGLLDSLASLQLSDNSFEGTIPSSLRKLQAMWLLALGGNELTGTIPTELGLLTNIETLDLSRNSKLTGPIDTLYNFANLFDLHVYNCDFTGTLSPLVGNFIEMEHLFINGNKFTGTIPPELGLNHLLWEIRIEDNQFTGTVPTEVCKMVTGRNDDENKVNPRQRLIVFSADCAPSPVDGHIELTCPCCSRCCEPSDRVCVEVVSAGDL